MNTQAKPRERACDVTVVGGGLGGLAAATLLARRGLEVEVLERASAPGGRAATHERSGFFFNEGAHALYRGGAAARVLGRMGVRWSGKRPPREGLAVMGGRCHSLPTTTGALLGTGLLSWSAKLRGARIMATLGALDTRALAGVPWSEWAGREVPDAAMRATLEAFVRVSTYAHAPASVSAGATLDQLALSSGAGVDYVDGGWGTLVDAAAITAGEAGARVRPGVPVLCAARDGSDWVVSTEAGPVRCRAVVLATGPAAARSIVASDWLARASFAAIPARAACLDVALSRLPDPHATFALGIDRPLYLSVHSRTARLAPAGAALVSTMKYLAPGEPTDGARDLAELESLLDLLQPGWRDVVLERRWLPSMVASNAIVTAAGGGTAGRPGPRVPDAPGVWVVGDWVGGEGMLLDASLASAERAADEVAIALAGLRVA
jgi:phytoene dehydrogenase-like protein